MKKITIKTQLEQLTRAELKQTKNRIRNYIESATLSIIGLEKKYGNEYEIDHCNGRSSLLINAFEEMAKTEAKKIANNFKPNKAELDVFRKAFEEEVKRQYGYVIDDYAKAKAKELAEERMKDVKIDIDTILKEELGEVKDDLPI